MPHMIAATTHINADFDALASLVAAGMLYPEALRLLPGQVQPAVRDFVAVHWDLLRLRARKEVDLTGLERLIVTDVSSWERLDDMRTLAARQDLTVTLWDHHMTPGTIVATELHLEPTGAVVTLLLEEIKARDLAFSPIHATLFLLGIYHDTGSLSYPSTTARDAHMAAFLLETGADLNVVAGYLASALDPRHLDLFGRMLEDVETRQIGGLRLGLCVRDVDKSMTMLPSVVSRFMEIKGLDVAFGIFAMSATRTAVIARASAREFDVGALLRHLGGGGHPGAASAMIQAPVETVCKQVEELISQAQIQEARVASLMEPVGAQLSPQDTVRQAADLLQRSGRQALLVIGDDNAALGTFGLGQVERIRTERQWDQPVTSMMRRQMIIAHPDQTLRESLQLMASSELGFLPVIEDGRLLGEITRGAILLSLYDF
jgi:tRNA nucleotidyltransferase (CCA-adding enzyme)